ncbi:HtaA domain-containing protein [Microbacterium sp. No. 7]|uniref:HtaA domain-containing protein n=1 Tax=Microbacterium sp. No. 7 TaxID=1714373 RepID=UPI0006D2A4FC|nr:HtaA domain-containing protein [Microbacterium sp. No. 7]ALJ18879.1 hypothetical protein AOA12_02715 [Microbacterium sp. No. 7]
MSGDAAPLRWGVKRSLVRYVAGVPDGLLRAFDGAVADDEQVFVFAADGSGADGVRRFRGSLEFTAHEGMLRIELSDPWVESDVEGALLTVFSPMDDRRVAMARLTPAGDAAWTAELLPRGADVLGPQYFAGTAIDPVRIGAG